ncbi:MAG: histidine kinase [Bacteroidaceae bacterium]|nr:histidine kinase [Bacteroidaceae bacterium]
MHDYKYITRVLLVSLVCAIFVSYPNMLFLRYDWECVSEECRASYINSMLIRFLLFWFFSMGLQLFNHHVLKTPKILVRILPNVLATLLIFGAYKGITALICTDFDCRPIIVTFQFTVLGMMGLLLGYTDNLNRINQKKEEELQMLKIESLQSRCTALTNQINPHFFFNSLNGISGLVRKKDDKLTICYIDHLSDIFRYILQSENRGLVTLEEEMEFAKSFSQVMQVRYAGKFDVKFDIPAHCLQRQIPVLALLPLIENVTVHNRIDSDHRMTLLIYVNEKDELVVSNPLYPKVVCQETHGTGLSNLEKRLMLLMDGHLRVEKDDKTFSVAVSLK